MKSLFKTTTILMFLFISFAGRISAQQTAALKGDWKLNKEKTDWGIFEESAASAELLISNAAGNLKIERVSPPNTDGGILRYTEEIPLNGNTKSIERPDGWVKENQLLSAENGKVLKLQATMYKPADKDNTLETRTSDWQLSPDGKTLTLYMQYIEPHSGNKGNGTFVYERVK